MSLPPSIRVNVRVPFPARVAGAAFIQVMKASGIWKILPDFRNLNPAVAVTENQVAVIQDSVTGSFSQMKVGQLVAAGGSVYREVAGGGAIGILSTDQIIVVTGAGATPTNVQLPQSSFRAGAPVSVKDLTYNAANNKITFVPATGETIDGFSASAAAANGVATIAVNGGFKQLIPLTIGGWLLR